MKLYFSESIIAGNFITRDRNNKVVIDVEPWVPFAPGELDWATLAPAVSEGLGRKEASWMSGSVSTHRWPAQVSPGSEVYACPEKTSLETAHSPLPCHHSCHQWGGHRSSLHGFVPFGLCCVLEYKDEWDCPLLKPSEGCMSINIWST